MGGYAYGWGAGWPGCCPPGCCAGTFPSGLTAAGRTDWADPPVSTWRAHYPTPQAVPVLSSASLPDRDIHRVTPPAPPTALRYAPRQRPPNCRSHTTAATTARAVDLAARYLVRCSTPASISCAGSPRHHLPARPQRVGRTAPRTGGPQGGLRRRGSGGRSGEGKGQHRSRPGGARYGTLSTLTEERTTHDGTGHHPPCTSHAARRSARRGHRRRPPPAPASTARHRPGARRPPGPDGVPVRRRTPGPARRRHRAGAGRAGHPYRAARRGRGPGRPVRPAGRRPAGRAGRAVRRRGDRHRRPGDAGRRVRLRCAGHRTLRRLARPREGHRDLASADGGHPPPRAARRRPRTTGPGVRAAGVAAPRQFHQPRRADRQPHPDLPPSSPPARAWS